MVKAQNLKAENAKYLNWLEFRSKAAKILAQHVPSFKYSEYVSQATRMLMLLKKYHECKKTQCEVSKDSRS
jgi:hypothetical protein